MSLLRYYLGIPVEADDFDPIFGGDCWVWATWPDGRRFLHWGDQMLETPWGESEHELVPPFETTNPAATTAPTNHQGGSQ